MMFDNYSCEAFRCTRCTTQMSCAAENVDERKWLQNVRRERVIYIHISDRETHSIFMSFTLTSKGDMYKDSFILRSLQHFSAAFFFMDINRSRQRLSNDKTRHCASFNRKITICTRIRHFLFSPRLLNFPDSSGRICLAYERWYLRTDQSKTGKGCRRWAAAGKTR